MPRSPDPERALLVRRLTANDAPAFRALRLEALRAHPDAFGADYEDEAAKPVERFAHMLDADFVLGGGLAPGGLDGLAGVYLPAARKARHKAVLWTVYVRPEARGLGLAEALVRGCIDHARTCAEEIMLAVGTHNAAAIARYRSLGFVECGHELRALKTGGRCYDELLMSIRFGPA